MYSFLIAVLILIAGYFIYGKITERRFGPDGRETPAVSVNDGVDYIPMPVWKVFMIQLLNIAGTGPIFGALGGALFGPIVYLWIVFGCIFAGAVHDYFCGMLSMRHNGASISELTGHYLGNGMRQLMRVFSVVLLVMCGVVFTTGPAGLLDILTNGTVGKSIWLWIIIVYYFVATFVPIDKVIGRIYPLFGICLIFMAMGVSGSMLFSGSFEMPEVWNNLSNQHCSGLKIWPFMFITVACGAISGFHATQSPMMARFIRSEKQGKTIFYGAMIAEGIIALVWAAAGVTCYEDSQALLDAGAGCSAVVYHICQTTMGKIGSVLALVGVVVCPMSSGDTAYRSARLTLADWFRLDQSKMRNRLLLTVPLLGAGTVICGLDYSIVWRYFSWSNQTLAMIALWTFSVYLRKQGKNCLITAIPAMFMSAVTITYFLVAPECLGGLWTKFGVGEGISYPAAVLLGVFGAILFLLLFVRRGKKGTEFLAKADAYEKGRAGYSEEFVQDLQKMLDGRKVGADIGSGTGIMTETLLRMGKTVYAVEPNGEMRRKAEGKLGNLPDFVSVASSGEETTLPDHSLDFLICASSFHWLDYRRFREECLRVLKPGAPVIICINNRKLSDDFSRKQDRICRKYCRNYTSLAHGYQESAGNYEAFYGGKPEEKAYDFPLSYTVNAFVDRCMSSSYSLKPGEDRFEDYRREIRSLAEEYAEDGILVVSNQTLTAFGSMKEA